MSDVELTQMSSIGTDVYVSEHLRFSSRSQSCRSRHILSPRQAFVLYQKQALHLSQEQASVVYQSMMLKS